MSLQRGSGRKSRNGPSSFAMPTSSRRSSDGVRRLGRVLHEIQQSRTPRACWVSRRARPNLRFYVNLILFGGEPGPECGAAVHDIGERLGLLGHVAKHGLVAVVVAHELERGALDRLPARHDPDQHADPIAVLSPTMAGVE